MSHHIRFRLQGAVQGVKLRRYVEAAARHFEVGGFCVNKADGAEVFGEAHGAPARVALFEAWVRGDWRAEYTDLKPTPVGTAYPARARVDAVAVEDVAATTAPAEVGAKLFAMVRDPAAALALERDHATGLSWAAARTSKWPSRPLDQGSSSPSKDAGAGAAGDVGSSCSGNCSSSNNSSSASNSNSNSNSRSVTASGSAVYESATAVQEYLAFHYQSPSSTFGAPYFPFTDAGGDAQLARVAADKLLGFAQRCGRICGEHAAASSSSSSSSSASSPHSSPGSPPGDGGRALDVGCAVGASSFELSKTFREVVGVDFSAAFVAAAEAVRTSGKITYARRVEGDIFEDVSMPLDPAAKADRCKFVEGDACALDVPSLGKFQCILAANLLCRLPRPRDFLGTLDALLDQGGFVVFVSPYSWLGEYTNKTRWLGGYTHGSDGAPVWSADVLTTTMREAGFSLVAESDVPFLIREHRRKYQLGVSHCTIFTRVADADGGGGGGGDGSQ